MPSKRSILLFLLCLVHIFTHAQQITRILTGKIVGEQEKSLGFTTVSLLDHLNTTVYSIAADSAGVFKLSYSVKGRYTLVARHTGYNTYTSAAFELADKDFGLIVLTHASADLKQVTVQSQQNLIQLNAGSIIYNVSGNIDAQGISAFEALKKAPGVFVNNDNTVTLNGKAGVLILIDGKQTYLSGQELTDLLRSMPASGVLSIDISANPSAKFDASGAAGIINIKTIKNRLKGFNGTATTGISYGIVARQSQDLILNYRKKNFHFFGSYNHFIGHYKYVYGSDRLQGGKAYNSATDDTDKRNRVGARIGMDYLVDKKNTIGVLLTSNFILGGGFTHTKTTIGSASPVIEKILYADNDYYYQRTARYNLNLNYRYENASGTSFNVDGDYGSFTKGNGNLQSNIYTDAQDVFLHGNLYRSLNNIDIRLAAAKIDYATPLLKGVIETGAKYSSVHSANDARFFHSLPQGDSIDQRRTNAFAFTEDVSSAYLNYKKTSGKWSVQGGLRMEHTSSDGALSFTSGGSITKQNTPRQYTNLFPSFSIALKPSAAHSVSFAYGRRIDRPAYQDLNPFIYLLDELSFWQGNAYLQPQLSHRLTLQYAYKSQSIVSLNVAYTDDYSARITDTIETNKIVMIPRNLGVQQNISLSFTQNLTLKKWWDLTFNGTLNHLHNKVMLDEYRHINLEQLAAKMLLQQRLKLPANVSAEVSLSVNSRRLTGANQFNRGNSQADIALQRNFMNNKATVRLAINDVYKGNRFNATQQLQGFSLNSYGYYESRQLRLNFTYRFADNSVKGPRNRGSALDNENGRIN